MAPVVREIEKYPDMLDPVIVVTGQHRQMLDQVLRICDIRPDHDLGMRWDDPDLGIAWPVDREAAVLSDRDRTWPMLGELPRHFPYEGGA